MVSIAGYLQLVTGAYHIYRYDLDMLMRVSVEDILTDTVKYKLI